MAPLVLGGVVLRVRVDQNKIRYQGPNRVSRGPKLSAISNANNRVYVANNVRHFVGDPLHSYIRRSCVCCRSSSSGSGSGPSGSGGDSGDDPSSSSSSSSGDQPEEERDSIRDFRARLVAMERTGDGTTPGSDAPEGEDLESWAYETPLLEQGSVVMSAVPK